MPTASSKIAYLVEKNMPADKQCEILKEARAAREDGKQLLVVT